jgi:peptidyl-prolyl cis-trans isomerase C
MIKPPRPRPAARLVWASCWRRRSRLAGCAAVLIAIAGAAHAADSPKLAPPAAQTKPAPVVAPPLLATPAEALTAMADTLAKNGDAFVADVGGLKITQADLADVIRAMPVSMASLGFKALYRRALDQVLREKLLVLDARKAGFDKDPGVVRREKAAADHTLAEAWLMHQADAAVTPEALHARYDREIAGKPGPEEVRARVILVATEFEARRLIGELQSGADFADLASKFSIDSSASNGGDIGYVSLPALSPEVGSIMFAMLPGQVTPFPVHAAPGWFILRVEGRRQKATPSFDDARAALTQELRREAATALVQSMAANVRVPETPPDGAAPSDAQAGARKPADR